MDWKTIRCKDLFTALGACLRLVRKRSIVYRFELTLINQQWLNLLLQWTTIPSIMSLRQSLIAQLHRALDTGPFTAADFEIATQFELSDTLLQVHFRHDAKYYFEVEEGSSAGSARVSCSPGQHQDIEHWLVDDLGELPSLLSKWSKDVRTELRAVVPAYEELDALRAKVEEHLENHITNPDALFTEEEAITLRSQLNELSEKFQKMGEENEAIKKQMTSMQRQVADLTTNLEGFSKRTWYHTAATKLWKTSRAVITSPEGRAIATEAVKKAIGL